jgi:dienelactone hydrolase
MQIDAEPFILGGTDGAPIRGTVRAAGDARRAIIVSHGFKGFADWGSMPHICTRLASAGFAAVAMNFSHNGIGESGMEFTEPELFSLDTVSAELHDLRTVVDALGAGRLPLAAHATQPCGLLGHSRGGGISILAAEGNADVGAVALWGCVATFDRFTERAKREWRERGSIETEVWPTGENLRMSAAYLDDLQAHQDAFDLERAIAALTQSILIVHGEQDLTVPLREADRLRAAAHWAEHHVIPATGHTFGAVHPFEGATPALERAIDLTVEFFSRTLLTSG